MKNAWFLKAFGLFFGCVHAPFPVLGGLQVDPGFRGRGSSPAPQENSEKLPAGIDQPEEVQRNWREVDSSKVDSRLRMRVARGVYSGSTSRIGQESLSLVVSEHEIPRDQYREGLLSESIFRVHFRYNKVDFPQWDDRILSHTRWSVGFSTLRWSKEDDGAYPFYTEIGMNVGEIQREVSYFFDSDPDTLLVGKNVWATGAVFWRLGSRVSDRVFSRSDVWLRRSIGVADRSLVDPDDFTEYGGGFNLRWRVTEFPEAVLEGGSSLATRHNGDAGVVVYAKFGLDLDTFSTMLTAEKSVHGAFSGADVRLGFSVENRFRVGWAIGVEYQQNDFIANERHTREPAIGTYVRVAW